MSQNRQAKKNLKISSRNEPPCLTLRAKMGEFEFEASGPSKEVIEQFVVYRDLLKGLKEDPGLNFYRDPSRQENPPSLYSSSVPQRNAPTLQTLERVFQNDPDSAFVICRSLPSGETRQPDTVLLLLLGYREFRAKHQVPVVSLRQALTRSGCRVGRLDRVLKTYVKDHFVEKVGRGKGGKYQLTNLGLQKAFEKASELAILYPKPCGSPHSSLPEA